MAREIEPSALLDAFAHVADGVFAVDAAMRIVYWNLAAEQIFGLAEASAIGRRCDDIVAGFESNGALLCTADCRVIGCVRRGHAPETYDLRRTGADGEQQWLNVSIVVLRGRSRRSTLAVHLVRDVTARRSIEAEATRVLSALRDTTVSAPHSAPITRREAEVLRLLACGATNREIATTLGISPTTARNHIEHLLAKLGVHSKLEAVVYAARTGLV
jgi:PAS domain S-box-containing protein